MKNVLMENVKKTIARIKELESNLDKEQDPVLIKKMTAELKIQKNSLEAYRIAQNID